jgi:hypothetical protein
LEDERWFPRLTDSETSKLLTRLGEALADNPEAKSRVSEVLRQFVSDAAG